MEERQSVKSVSHYIDAIKSTFEHLNDPNEVTPLWFRGEGRSDWTTPLCPKAYRIYGGPLDKPEFNNHVFQEWESVERNIKATFSREAHRFMLRNLIPPESWNLYFLMQHYGLKTRLLDWTENALIALFFAVNERFDSLYDGRVWILAPHRLNKHTTKYACGIPVSAIAVPEEVKEVTTGITVKRGLVNMNDLCHRYLTLDMKKYVLYPGRLNTRFFPLAIYPSLLDERMANQQSCFTIFGDEVNGLLLAENHYTFLQSIVIEGNKKESIKEELRWLGITYKSINPDLDGLCKSIEDIYNYDHVSKRIK